MLKINNIKVIDINDWNELVTTTYNRSYNFQQQDGCKYRGYINITVPEKYIEDYENDIIPEVVNHEKMGVSFKAWLSRDPKQKLKNREDQNDFSLVLWWNRNFYPHVSMLINDLYAKGLLEAGEYSIDIDW